MRKIFILLFCALAFGSRSQNVFKTVDYFNKYKDSISNYATVLNYLSQYVSPLSGKTPSYVDSSFIQGLKSIALKNAFNILLTTKKQAIKDAEKNKANIVELVNKWLPEGTSVKDKLNASEPIAKILDDVKKIATDTVNKSLSRKFTYLIDSISKSNTKGREPDNKVIAMQFLSQTKKQISAISQGNPLNSLHFEVSNVVTAAKEGINLPSESDVIDAMAIFIANRIKEETVMAFVEQVNNRLEKLEPLPHLFKNTIKEMNSYAPGESIRFGALLKKAIATDLANMPDNILSCSSCKGASDLSKLNGFSSFFTDLEDGVDLITNIEYYSELQYYSRPQKQLDTSTRFMSALRVFRFINRYFSHLEDPKSQETWENPGIFNRENFDADFKLALALIYEKETSDFYGLLHNRYGVENLDQFFADTSKYNTFKRNFQTLLYKLHWLDSYWQNNKKGGKALVNMEIYSEKVSSVFSTLYTVLSYTNTGDFPLDNEAYRNYVDAKKAVVRKDMESVIFLSQKLLDLLSCYDIKLPQLQLPQLNIKWPAVQCQNTPQLSENQFNLLTGNSAVKLSDMEGMHNSLKSEGAMSSLARAIICHHLQQNDTGKCKQLGKRFRKSRARVKKQVEQGNYKNALDDLENPWCMRHWLAPVFNPVDWRISLDLWHLRKKQKQHSDPENDALYTCYLKQDHLRNKLSFSGARRDVSQILSLLADVNKAKGSGELSKVIEEYAEPPQSYKIKRYNNFSLDLNAYPGFYAGFETRAGYNLIRSSKRDSLTSGVTGFTAPIGISFSWGGRVPFTCERSSKYPGYISRRGKLKAFRGGAFSATFTFIDIGAVVSYRLSNDASKALPKSVSFSQVAAPGFFFGYGIPGVPIVINAGVQYTPQLRTFEGMGNAPLDSYRATITVAYDIPFFNLANTSKKMKRKQR